MAFFPRTRWFQFSLRTLLMAVTVLCIGPGGYLVYQRQLAKREAAAVAKLKEVPGQQLYVRPDWLRTLLARGSTGYVVGAAFPSPETTAADIAPVSDLSALVWLNLNATDEGLDPVVKLTHLETLRLDETEVTDAGLLKLARLKRLKTLNVYKTRVTNEGVKRLQAALPELDVIR